MLFCKNKFLHFQPLQFHSIMPLVYQQNINEDTKLAVWQIDEDVAFFASELSVQKAIHHPIKRLHHFAGRYLLTQLDPNFPIAEIEIMPSKKPFIKAGDWYFSVAHSGNYAAAIISRSSNVGIDVEAPNVKVLHLKSKFLSENEMVNLSAVDKDEITQLTIGWSIKEVLFKWYGLGQLDFKSNLQIKQMNVQKENWQFACTVDTKETQYCLVEVKLVNDMILSWMVK
jgi:phosphopantetheinyl transferase